MPSTGWLARWLAVTSTAQWLTTDRRRLSDIHAIMTIVPQGSINVLSRQRQAYVHQVNQSTQETHNSTSQLYRTYSSLLSVNSMKVTCDMWHCDLKDIKQEGLAVASIARDVGSSSTNRSSNIMH